MRPVGRRASSSRLSQASAHSPHGCRRAEAVPDVDPRRAGGDAGIAIDAIAGRPAGGAQGAPPSSRGAGLAARSTRCEDVEEVGVGEARPHGCAATGTCRCSRPARAGGRRAVGRGGQGQDGEARPAGLEGRELAHLGRRVGEVEHPGAAGPPGDQEPDRVLEGAQGDLLTTTAPKPSSFSAPAGVALDQALDREKQVGPDRLRAEVAALSRTATAFIRRGSGPPGSARPIT